MDSNEQKEEKLRWIKMPRWEKNIFKERIRQLRLERVNVGRNLKQATANVPLKVGLGMMCTL